MAYEQVGTILDHTAAFHQRAAAGFRSLVSKCQQPRARMLLSYLGEHEHRLEQAVERFHDELAPRVLDAWVTTTHETSELANETELPNKVEGDVDDVLDLGMKTDGKVIAVFEELVNRDAPEWVTEAFGALLQIEKQFERQMVQQAARGREL